MKALSRLTKASPAASQTLKIGEVAKASGAGIETLRFYEKGDVTGHVCGLIEGSHIGHGMNRQPRNLRKKK